MLLASEHPKSWVTVRKVIGSLLGTFTPELKPQNLNVNLRQRDPLEVHAEFIDEAKIQQIRLPQFNLTQRFALNTSTRTTPLLLPTFHQEQCLSDTRSSQSASRYLEHVNSIQRRLPKSPLERASASVRLKGSQICTSISLKASEVSPKQYPHLRVWLSEVEHVLDLNGSLIHK